MDKTNLDTTFGKIDTDELNQELKDKIKCSIIFTYIYYYMYILSLLIIANPRNLAAGLETNVNCERSCGWTEN